MSKVREWLEAIGLAQYADAFEANDIDLDLLGQVDDQMLKDIGVSSGGHRLRIRHAIAKLSPASPLSKNEDATSAATEPKIRDVAERRQVTVMFSDLVGSTALSARMDPEDLREVVSAYQKCVAETVQRFVGFVAKYMGDGVLVYFGYPRAHEDEAERSARAALDIVAAMADLNAAVLRPPGVELTVRIGIATGPVIVGDQIDDTVGLVQGLQTRSWGKQHMRRLAGQTGAGDVVLHDVDGVGERIEISRRGWFLWQQTRGGLRARADPRKTNRAQRRGSE